MDFMIVKEAAEKWGITVRRVQQLCEDGRIPGAIRPARDWLIPKDAERPFDGRRKADNQPKKELQGGFFNSGKK